MLSSLRATALSWAAAKYPAHGSELRPAALAAAIAATKARQIIPVAAKDVTYADTAAASVASAARAGSAAASAARAASTAASLAPSSATDADGRAAVYAAARSFGTADALAADADLIDAGRSGSELMGLPVWPNGAPDWATEAWGDLKSRSARR